MDALTIHVSDNFMTKAARIIAAATEAMLADGRAFSRIADLLVGKWMAILEKLYLQHHRRLPGNSRNSRLIKKRRTLVLKWAADYFRRGLAVESECEDAGG